jgi:hypothetical protein
MTDSTLRQTLECPVCFDEIQEVILNCGHSFCKKCIVRLAFNGSVECPICKFKTDDVSKCPQNYLVKDLIERVLNITSYCEFHPSLKIELHCAKCSKFLCKQCSHETTHDICDLNEASNSYKEILNQNNLAIKIMLDNINRWAQYYRENVGKIESKIQAVYINAIEEITRQRDKAMNELVRISNRQFDSTFSSISTENRLESLELLYAKSSNLSKDADLLLCRNEHLSVVTRINSFKAIADQLSSLYQKVENYNEIKIKERTCILPIVEIEWNEDVKLTTNKMQKLEIEKPTRRKRK